MTDDNSENIDVNINKDKTLEKMIKREKSNKGLTVGKVIARTFLCIFTLIVVLSGGILAGAAVISYGPSESARIYLSQQ